MVEAIGVIGTMIDGLLGLQIPGTGITMGGLAIIGVILATIGWIIHSMAKSE